MSVGCRDKRLKGWDVGCREMILKCRDEGDLPSREHRPRHALLYIPGVQGLRFKLRGSSFGVMGVGVKLKGPGLKMRG